MKLPNWLYDILKWACLIFLPATAILYVTLAGAWGWPLATEISVTINAIALFIGALIGVSTLTYDKQAIG